MRGVLAIAGVTGVLAAQGPSPIQRVVKLLNEMADKLEEERKKDEETYEALQCWCKTNLKATETAVKQQKKQAGSLAAEIASESGKEGEYKAKHERAAKKAKELENQLDELNKSHDASMTDLTDEEAELVGTVTALEGAINVLSKHNSLLQTNPEVGQAVKAIMHSAAQKSRILLGKEPPTVEPSFLQAATPESALVKAMNAEYDPYLSEKRATSVVKSFLQSAAPAIGYANQSGAIFGVLNTMLDDFKQDLQGTKTKIAEEEKSYASMKKSLMTQGAAQRKTAEEMKAAAQRSNFLRVEGKAELEKLRASVTADQKMFTEIEQHCQGSDRNIELRRDARAAETKAVQEAIAVLEDDENRSAIGTGFLQLASSSDSVKSWGDLQYNMLATKSQQKQFLKKVALVAQQSGSEGHFDDLIARFKKIVADIKAEAADDIAKKDECSTSIKDTETALREAQRALSQAEGSVESLTKAIEETDEKTALAKEEVAEMEKSILAAGEDRQAENKDFQQTVTEQREMQKVVQMALDKLKSYYGFIQTSSSSKMVATSLSKVAPPPPPGDLSGPYKPVGGATGVVGMIETIITDSKDLEKDAVKEESEAQANYEKFVADTRASIDLKLSEIADNEVMRANQVSEKSSSETDAVDATDDIKAKTDALAALHGECDFLLKYFTQRQEAHTTEREALQKAIAILSGSSQG